MSVWSVRRYWVLGGLLVVEGCATLSGLPPGCYQSYRTEYRSPSRVGEAGRAVSVPDEIVCTAPDTEVPALKDGDEAEPVNSSADTEAPALNNDDETESEKSPAEAH